MNSKLRPLLESGALAVAPRLLGSLIEHETPQGLRIGRIIETEAYTQDDPASHSHGRRTPRNEVMFRRAGTLYVYLSYGVHACMNVVTGCEGGGEAVLIRAVEPVEGLDLMMAARDWRDKPLGDLANGPGKVCSALGVTLSHNGLDLLARRSSLRLLLKKPVPSSGITITPRIGITRAADWPRRFLWRPD